MTLDHPDWFGPKRIDVEPLQLGGLETVAEGEGAGPAHGGHIEDVEDGEPELVVHFPLEETDLRGGEETVGLIGETVDGGLVFGTESVRLVGNNRREEDEEDGRKGN